MGPRDSARERAWERAVLFGLVEPPPRRQVVAGTIRRLWLLIGTTLLAMFGVPAAAALAETFTVTSPGDGSQPGTLRNAITASNNSPQYQRAPNTINIELPAGVPDTVTLSSPLPAVQYPIVLNANGATIADTIQQPAGDVLDLAPGPNGGSSHSVITDGTFTGGLRGAGIGVFSNGNLITADTFTRNAHGLELSDGASRNTIGGGSASARNLISGNAGSGVLITGGTTKGNVVDGNYIGTNSSGLAGDGNRGAGVVITDGTHNNTVGGTVADTFTGSPNLISGNHGAGVLVNGGTTTGNVINGNLIGTSARGLGGTLLPNASAGVQFGGGATRNLLSGGVVVAGNDTVTLQLGHGANQVLRASMVGGPSGLIVGGQSIALSAGPARRAAADTSSTAVSYRVMVSAAPPNSRVQINLLSASCTRQTARLRYVSGGTVAVNGDGKGSGTVRAPSAPARPVFLADGSRGANNLSDPCPASAPVSNPYSQFLRSLFHDLLGRPPNASESAFFTNLLTGGLDRADVALKLENTQEYRQDLVRSFYLSFLARAPSPAELQSGVQALGSGQTDERLEAGLLGSGLFLAHAGGTNSAFLSSLYSDLLARSPSPGERSHWLNALMGGSTRAHVASAILASQEYRGDLAGGWYERFLRRPATPVERSQTIGLLGSGTTDEQVVALLLGSLEYFHQFTSPTITSLSLSSTGEMKLSLSQPVKVTLEVFHVVSPGTGTFLIPVVQRHGAVVARAKHFKLPKLHLIGAVRFGHRGRGRLVLHWRRRVHGRPLAKGTYALVLQVRRANRLVDASNTMVLRVR